MFFRNNRAIDTDILSSRICVELASMHCREQKVAKPISQELMPQAIAGMGADVVGPRGSEPGIADRIKRIPIVGEVATWVVWIVRVRQIARAPFTAQGAPEQVEPRVSGLEERIGAAASPVTCGGNAGEARRILQRGDRCRSRFRPSRPGSRSGFFDAEIVRLHLPPESEGWGGTSRT
jgi:hypothetical protein